MWQWLQNLWREYAERHDYIHEMTYPPFWFTLALGCTLYGLSLINQSVAEIIALIIGIPYGVYCLLIWAGSGKRPR